MIDTVMLRRQVLAALQKSPIHSHRLIEVDHDGESLHLSGKVESFYYKQLAQEVVRSICQGTAICNDLDVEEPSLTGSRIVRHAIG